MLLVTRHLVFAAHNIEKLFAYKFVMVGHFLDVYSSAKRWMSRFQVLREIVDELMINMKDDELDG